MLSEFNCAYNPTLFKIVPNECMHDYSLYFLSVRLVRMFIGLLCQHSQNTSYSLS